MSGQGREQAIEALLDAVMDAIPDLEWAAGQCIAEWSDPKGRDAIERKIAALKSCMKELGRDLPPNP